MVLCRPPIHADGRQLSTPIMRHLFNLQVRPFSGGSTTAYYINSISSGLFPSDGGDGRQAISSCKRGGDDQVPDCVFSFSCTVVYAKFLDQVVIFQFVEVLSVFCTTTPRGFNAASRSFGPTPVQKKEVIQPNVHLLNSGFNARPLLLVRSDDFFAYSVLIPMWY